MDEEAPLIHDVCPECSKRREDWTEEQGRGYALDGIAYCSERCAVAARARAV